jgi:hypothetical protein
MLPIVRSYSGYQAFVVEQLKLHYTDGVLRIIPSDWELIKKFWITDLSQTFSIILRVKSFPNACSLTQEYFQKEFPFIQCSGGVDHHAENSPYHNPYQ